MAEKNERLISKDYLLVMLAAMGTSFVNYFFFAALSPYMEFLKRTTFDAGLMTMVYSVAALVARPAAGILSDKFGRVKLLIVGAAICALTSLGFGVTTIFIPMLIIRALTGIGFGIHSTCAGAVVADVVPKSRLAEGIGYFGMYATVGQMVAPLIALAIIKGGTGGDFKALFFTAAGLCLMSTVCDCGLTYERKRKKAGLPLHEGVSEPAGKELAKEDDKPLPKTLFGFEYAVFPLIAVLIVMYFGLVSIMSYITLFAGWRGFENTGLFFTFSAIGVLVSRLIFGRIADKRGADVVIIPGTAVIVVCLAVLPLVGSMFQLAALAVPLGLAQGAALPAFNSMLFKRCSAARRGTASGAYFAAIDIGFAVGAPLLGKIADLLDYRYIYWVAAIFVALSLVIYVLIASDKRFKASQQKTLEKYSRV